MARVVAAVMPKGRGGYNNYNGGSNNGGGGYHQGGGGQNRGYGNNNSNHGGSGFQGKCNNCHLTGHKAFECKRTKKP